MTSREPERSFRQPPGRTREPGGADRSRRRPFEQDDETARTTGSLFARAIQEHLELKRRNSALEYEMPLEQYTQHHPSNSRPLFQPGEQAVLEDTLAGAPSTLPSLPRPDRPAGGEPLAVQPGGADNDAPDEGFWSRAREFDWGE